MQTPLHQTNISTEARLDAIEMLLQQLVFFLEAEPGFTVSDFSQWLNLVKGRMAETGSATDLQISALNRLQNRVIA
ncbi:hypothetical protein WAE61_18250 [Comamonadaceae bacterium PP-2]